MSICVECGKAIPRGCNKCMECNKKAIQKLFAANPEIKQAFKETLDEMRKPENVEKMARSITPVIQGVIAAQKMVREAKEDVAE